MDSNRFHPFTPSRKWRRRRHSIPKPVNVQVARYLNSIIRKYRERSRRSAGPAKQVKTYVSALESLKKYPLPLGSVGECRILKGFGDGICRQLERALGTQEGETERQQPKKIEVKQTSKAPVKRKPKVRQPENEVVYTEEIILLVDKAERSSALFGELTKLNCPFKKEHLSLGDFAWYDHSSASILCWFVIERKSARDLVSSIMDGRFQEQKLRLMKLRESDRRFQVVLLVEMASKSSSLFKRATVEQACMNALVLDGFQIVLTKNPVDTARYLAQMTKQANKNDHERIPIGVYNEINAKRAELKKIGGISVREAVARFLVQVKGLSVQRVSSLVHEKRFETFVRLIKSVDDCVSSSSELIIRKVLG